MSGIRLFIFIHCLGFALMLHSAQTGAAINIDPEPGWISADERCSTGGYIADVNNDGFPDFIVSNGNDMGSEAEVVYFGSAYGLSESAGWTSSDFSYSGHCVAGDLTGNGLPDLVVANYIASPSGFTETTSKIYFNTGQGFESAPSWTTADMHNTFSVALGDVDNDGDLDIATANGEAYSSRPQSNQIYFNDAGLIGTLPGWTSSDLDCSYDVEFADFDLDGDLDLAVANSGSPSRIYLNWGEGLETTASWSADTEDNDNSLAWGDIDADGFPDLAIISNRQLQGSGKIKIFRNRNGVISNTPDVIIPVPDNGYGSALLWADFDADGDADLAAGSWWGNVCIFENSGAQLSDTPCWMSNNHFVIESLTCLPQPESATVQETAFFGDGSTSLFQLPRFPIYRPITVAVDHQKTAASAYCCDPVSGWVSFAEAPEAGAEITVRYTCGNVGVLLATSWGDNNADGPNYGYRNLSVPTPSPTGTPVPATPTATPVPGTPTATPPDDAVQLTVMMNSTEFHGNDPLVCHVDIWNPFSPFSVDFYTLLEIEGQYFFYPGWNQDLQYEPLDLNQGLNTIEIFNFILPDPIGYTGPVTLISAIFRPGTYDLVCDFDQIEMFFSDE